MPGQAQRLALRASGVAPTRPPQLLALRASGVAPTRPPQLLALRAPLGQLPPARPNASRCAPPGQPPTHPPSTVADTESTTSAGPPRSALTWTPGPEPGHAHPGRSEPPPPAPPRTGPGWGPRSPLRSPGRATSTRRGPTTRPRHTCPAAVLIARPHPLRPPRGPPLGAASHRPRPTSGPGAAPPSTRPRHQRDEPSHTAAAASHHPRPAARTAPPPTPAQSRRGPTTRPSPGTRARQQRSDQAALVWALPSAPVRSRRGPAICPRPGRASGGSVPTKPHWCGLYRQLLSGGGAVPPPTPAQGMRPAALPDQVARVSAPGQLLPGVSVVLPPAPGRGVRPAAVFRPSRTGVGSTVSSCPE
ncbi:hypothetical protein C9F11_18255 [Streptomyces sp. YIM 121038]|nr:hypothetical protein C9F11_18255 [Streptomyces sp. YIM 121038]